MKENTPVSKNDFRLNQITSIVSSFFISSLSNIQSFWREKKKLLSIFTTIIIIAAIPLGVGLIGQKQIFKSRAYEVKQRAYEVKQLKTSEFSKNEKKPEYVPGELIIKLKNPLVVKKGVKTLDNKPVSLDNINTSDSQTKRLIDLFKDAQIKKVEKVFKGAEDPTKEINKYKKKYPDRVSSLTQDAINEDLSRIYKLSFKKDIPVITQIASLANSPDIEYVEPNTILHAFITTPNDPYFLDNHPDNILFRDPNWNPSYDYQWGLKKINSPNLTATSSANIIVAVIDTGIDYNHEDLQRNIWINNREIPNNGIDDDQNGYIDDYYGWNFANQNNNPLDDHGHGTHVAGIISAVNNNEIGISGVYQGVKIMGVKGLDNRGSGSLTWLTNSIYYAQQNGAKIINASWGAPGSSQTLKEVVDYVTSYGVVFVAAAGNSFGDSRLYTPANIRNSLTVGSSDINDQKSDFSNNIGIDFLAPGGNSSSDINGNNILSLRALGTNRGRPNIVGEKYLRARGTSMATPFVAGAIATLLGNDPSLKIEETRSILRLSADKMGQNGWHKDQGYGRINIGQALNLLSSNTYNVARIISPESSFIATSPLQFSFLAYGSSFSKWVLEYGEGVEPLSWSLISEGTSPSYRDAPRNISFDTSELTIGKQYSFRLRVLGTNEVEDRLLMDNPFQLKWSFRSNRGFTTSSPAIIDLNGDNRKELVIKDNDAYIYILRNNGELIKTIIPSRRRSQLFQDTVTVANLDQDMRGREIISWSSDKLHLFDADGDEKLTPPWPLSFHNDVESPRPAAPLITDIDGDGLPEILILATIDGSQKALLLNSSGENLNNNWPKIVPGGSVILAGKFFPSSNPNNKAKQILVAASDGQISIFDYLGQQLSSFVLVSGVSSAYPSIVLADLNNDGFQEIIAKFNKEPDDRGGENFASAMGVYTPEGNKVWEKTIGLEGFNATLPVPIISDLNGDGSKNIVVSSENKIFFFDKDGNNVPGWPGISLINILNFVSGDRDGDGKQEIYFVQSMPPAIGMIEQGKVVSNTPLLNTPMILAAPAIGDIDNDNHLELIVAGTFGSPLMVYDLGIKSNNKPFKLDWSHYLYSHERTSSVLPALTCTACRVDINKDGSVNARDYSYLIGCFEKDIYSALPDGKPCSWADINDDSKIDTLDFNCLDSQYKQSCITPTPTRRPTATPRPKPTSTPTPTTSASVTTVTIRAWGNIYNDNPKIRLSDGNITLQQYTITSTSKPSAQLFIYTFPKGKTFKNKPQVSFINDAYGGPGRDRNAYIDYIEINKVRYESEDPKTYSSGSWTKSNGCRPGYKKQEVLACNGYFRYNQYTP